MRNEIRIKGRKLPEHWWECRGEAEEAQWWEANSGRVFEEAVRKVALKIAALEEMVREAKRRMRGERRLTLRLPEEVLQAAKAQAADAGVPYQTLMRKVLTEGFAPQERPKQGAALERRGAREWKVRAAGARSERLVVRSEADIRRYMKSAQAKRDVARLKEHSRRNGGEPLPEDLLEAPIPNA